ncbi:MAG TPA: amidohydrolase family protein [Firmicutes bacterium]|nr:amidohydrolase family protein [Candidatus Fermentithermobacillaceae bacterium]
MRLVLNASWLIDGLNDEPLENACVIIEGSKIVYAGPRDTAPYQVRSEKDDSLTIGFEDAAILPGLIDCHVHLTSTGMPEDRELSLPAVRSGGPRAHDSLDPSGVSCLPYLSRISGAEASLLTAIAVKNMEKCLKGGVTTVRDLGAPNEVILTLRDMERACLITGPRIVASGAVITTTGGHGYRHGIECDSALEVRKAARAQLKAGVDVIKIMSSGGVFTALSKSSNCQYTVDELKEAVVEAEKSGKKVATHVHANEAIKRAVLAGIHSIEHGIFLDEECISLMLDRGTFLVPTLAPHKYIWGNKEIHRIPKIFLEKASMIREPNFESTRKAIAAGVKIAAGTDSGIPFMEHGRVVTEIEVLHEIGMKPMDAIRAATSRAAELLQVDREVGTVEPGKVADLMVVKGNPVRDLKVLRNPKLVIHEGKIVAVDPEVGISQDREILFLAERNGWPE